MKGGLVGCSNHLHISHITHVAHWLERPIGIWEGYGFESCRRLGFFSLELFMFSQWAANWPTFIYRISQKTNKYQPCFFHKTSLHTITVFLLTSASLSLCTPAKSNASLRNPCLSVRSMDAITARHSCHTLFQFPCLSGSEGLELPWDWGAFDMNSKFGLMCYYLIGHGRIAQFSGDS